MTKQTSTSPAWLQAIVWTFILLIPIVILNQTIIIINLKKFPQLGLSFLLVLGSLYLYWQQATKWYPFRGKSDIKLNLSFNIFSLFNLLSIIGLFLFTISIILLGFMLSGINPMDSRQVMLIQEFSDAPPLTAVLLLSGLALTAGLVEEVTFRGFVQSTTNKAYPKVISYLIIGIIFSLVHFLPWQLLLSYTLVSVAFSVVADQQKSTGLVIFTHTLIDIVVFLLHYFGMVDFLLNAELFYVFAVMLVSVFMILLPKPNQRSFSI